MSATITQSTCSATQIAEDAFIYGFPLIMNYGIMYEYAVNPNSGQYKAPFNQIFNQANAFTPKDMAIVTPNCDTPYSLLWMDLRAEPVALSLPEVDTGRYYQCSSLTFIRIISPIWANGRPATRPAASWSRGRTGKAQRRPISIRCSSAKPCSPQPHFARSSLGLLILTT